MGIAVSPSSQQAQNARLKIKSLDQKLKAAVIKGAGISPWEADMLIQIIHEHYFSDPALREMENNQLRYTCVAATEKPGKPLKDCQMQTVRLTLIYRYDSEELPSNDRLASATRRQRKIMRLSVEAREQGGLLTQEDLAAILNSDVRTIRRDIKKLSQLGMVAPTRGQQKDIGPGVSHRALAVRLWLDGKEPVDIARNIHHSVAAVENYLEKFKRVAFLRGKRFNDAQIAMTVGISVYATNTFSAIYNKSQRRPFFKDRLAEINLVGEQFYVAQDEKKRLSSPTDSREEGRRP